MKIIYWAPYMGKVGTIKAVINSARAMKQFGNNEVYIIKAYSEWEGCEDEIRNIGANVIDFKLKKIFPKLPEHNLGFRISMIVIMLFSLSKLIKVYNSHKPDIVIANLLILPALIAKMFARNKPVFIVSMQGYPKFLENSLEYGYSHYKKYENMIRKFLWQTFYKKADLFVAMSEKTKKLVCRELGINENRIGLIPNPIIDETIVERSKDVIDHEWYKNKLRPIIIGVGRLTEQKNFRTLIRAFSLVMEKIDARLVLLGEGEDRSMLEDLVRDLRLEDHVWMPGFVDNPYNYMARSDVFVLSSLWEDPGHVIIEAAFLEVPIVSTDCPNGPAELLGFGKGGYLCNMRDHKAMAEQIIFILKNRDCAEVKDKVIYSRQMSENYSPKSHYGKLIRLMRATL